MEEGYVWYKCINCGTYVGAYAGLDLYNHGCNFCEADEFQLLTREELKELINGLNVYYGN